MNFKGLLLVSALCLLCGCTTFEDTVKKMAKENNYNQVTIEKKTPVTEEVSPSTDLFIELGNERYNIDRLIYKERLEKLDKESLAYLRNAIFAKHGYMFKTEKYKTYFGSMSWYVGTLENVEELLSDTDKSNIKNIIELEKRTEQKQVFKASYPMYGKNYSYEFVFDMDTRMSEGGKYVYFNNFQGYIVKDKKKEVIFELIQKEDEQILLRYETSNLKDLFSVEDRDGDGSEEFYFRTTNIIYDEIYVVQKLGTDYKRVFHGYSYNPIFYQDVNGNGMQELINEHGGGGGYVSWWTGLKLVNEFKEEVYTFSYELTRSYYEQVREEKKAAFMRNKTPERFVDILNAYADLGDDEACKNLISDHPDLVHNEAYDYSLCFEGPDADFFGYVLYRAREYKVEWENMKTW